MATTLSDLLVRLDIDSAKFRDGIEQTNKSLTKLNKRVEDMSDDMAMSVLKGVASWDILKNAAGSVFDFMAKGVKDFAEAEQATLRLSNSITQLGYSATDLLAPLQAQADAFEATTLNSSESVQAIQSLLLQYHIAPKDIEKTTAAILDYSAATGKDAQAATLALVKSLDGDADSLKALGIRYTQTGDKAKDFSNILEAVNEKFGGSAQAAAAGLTGEIFRMEDAWGDLGKAAGGFFATVESKLHVLSTLTTAINNFRIALGGGNAQENFDKNVGKIKELVNQREALKDQLGAGFGFNDDFLKEQIELLDNQIRELQKANAELQKSGKAGHGGPGEITTEAIGPMLGPEEESRAEREKRLKEAADKEARAREKIAEEAKRAAEERFRKEEAEVDKLMRERQRLAEQADRAVAQEFQGWLDRAQALTDSVMTPLEIMQRDLAEAASTFDKGLITNETLARLNALIRQRFEDALANSPEAKEAEEAQRKATKAAEDAAKEEERARQKIAQTFINFANNFGATLGGGAEMVAGAVTDIASGNWIQAIIDVFMKLFSNFEGFSKLMDQSNGMLMNLVDQLAPVFELLISALQPLLGAVSYLVGVVLDLVAPILNALIPILDSITPIIMIVAVLLKGLQPVFEFLGLIIKGVITILDVILRAVFFVVQGIGLALLGVIYGLASAWNGIISAIQYVFRKLGDISIFGAHPLGFLKDWAKGMDSAKADTDALGDAMNELASTTWDSATAQAENQAAVDETTGSLKEMNETLTNIPSIFKVVAQRFRAALPNDLRLVQNLGSIPHFAEGGVVTSATLGLIGEGNNGPEIVSPESMLRAIVREEGGDTYIFNVVAGTGRELYDQFRRLTQRDRFTQTGYTVVGG